MTNNFFFLRPNKFLLDKEFVLPSENLLCRLEFGFKGCTVRTWGPGWVASAGLLGQQRTLRSVWTISSYQKDASVPWKNLAPVNNRLSSWLRPETLYPMHLPPPVMNSRYFYRCHTKVQVHFRVDGSPLGFTNMKKHIFKIPELLVTV